MHYPMISSLESKRRTFSSSSSSSKNSTKQQQQHPFENTFGLAFTISPDTAITKFIQWAQQEQGLNRFLLNPKSITLTANYCPVWSFDLNIRYILIHKETKQKRLDWKPEFFATIYGSQSIVHLPGLSTYSGYMYRRSLIDPLHNTALVFLGDKVVPFGAWMLRDMTSTVAGTTTTTTIPIIPDPWNTPQGRAITIVKEGLVQSAMPPEDSNVQIQTEVVASRRVYMPTYAIRYTILGMEYQAFVSGCDDGVAVSGISHKIFTVDPTQQLASAATSATTTGTLSTIVSFVQYTFRTLGGRQVGTILVVALQFIGSFVVRLLMRLPLIGALGGAFVGFRKIIQPWMDNRFANAEWERQREREASHHDKVNQQINDFTDTGTAQRYFRANKDRILRQFAGTNEHTEGSYSWYSEWEKWARQQWEQQQRQQQQQQQGYQQQQQTRQQPRQQKTRPQTEYVWDFDPNDPYSVLGIRRGATAAEVTAAFRKQMLMHHPDTKSDSSEAVKARAIERSKIITNAYQTIKSQMKRRQR